MKVLVYYVDFHWDNHQGGSGKSFEMRYTLDIPGYVMVESLRDYITNSLSEHVAKQRPFRQHEAASITRIEIV
jgi:hypothetical protein